MLMLFSPVGQENTFLEPVGYICFGLVYVLVCQPDITRGFVEININEL